MQKAEKHNNEADCNMILSRLEGFLSRVRIARVIGRCGHDCSPFFASSALMDILEPGHVPNEGVTSTVGDVDETDTGEIVWCLSCCCPRKVTNLQRTVSDIGRGW